MEAYFGALANLIGRTLLQVRSLALCAPGQLKTMFIGLTRICISLGPLGLGGACGARLQ
jgi:hypothetical protein